jgi:hypothetical protein
LSVAIRFRIPIHVIPAPEAGTSVQRTAEPVTCGVPFPSGAFSSGASCRLTDAAGDDQPLQWEILSQWSDGSAQWVLIDFAATLGAEPATWILSIHDGGQPTAGESRARIGADGTVTAAAGTSQCVVPGRHGLFTVRTGDDTHETAIVRVHDAAGRAQAVRFTDPVVETAGHLRSVVAVTGEVDLGGRRLLVAARLHFFASTPVVRIEITVHNPARAQHPGNYWELGDPASVLFKALTVTLPYQPGSARAVQVSEQAGESLRGSYSTIQIHQESSGGPQWDSPVHQNRDGRVPLRFRGYTMRSDLEEREGLRVEPIVRVSSGGESLSVFLDGFWQEFPSALTVSNDGTVTVSPFPADAVDVYELQGGERKTRRFAVSLGDDTVSEVPLQWLRRPTMGRTDPQHYAESGVLPFFVVDGDPRHDALLAEAIEGPRSFSSKREAIDEYGWRNFGDLYADHEAAFQTGPALFASHYNNQYDAIAGFALQFMRTGNRRWWHLMEDLAKHVADIDVYHTTEDKAAYSGGLFWHSYHYVEAGRATHRSYPRAQGVAGGGPSAEHNYNAGLALHYYLTGWKAARDVAVSLADWVVTMDDGRRTPFRWLAGGATGLASASGSPLYHGPGRGGGNSIKALLTAFQLSGHRRYLDKAEELLRRCINPDDNIESLNLLDAERRWYYTVFLEAVGLYLWQKAARGELDQTYDYARCSLLHYARWMCEHEYPYLDRPEILEYPNETWSAQDMRKSEVLAVASLCAQGPERDQMLDTSRRFFEDVLTRLPALPTHHYTRPMALLLTRGYALPWVRQHRDAALPDAHSAGGHERPVRFEPQKVRAMRRAKVVAGALFVSLAGLLIWLGWRLTASY